MGGPNKRPYEPYVDGAGDLPNDYGREFDGHRNVNPAYRRTTNMNIAAQHMTDGNLSGIQHMYGTEGVPGGAYTEGPGLGPEAQAQFGQQQRGLGAAITELSQVLGGDDIAIQVIDEIMRVAASEDAYGPMEQPDNSQMPPVNGFNAAMKAR